MQFSQKQIDILDKLGASKLDPQVQAKIFQDLKLKSLFESLNNFIDTLKYREGLKFITLTNSTKPEAEEEMKLFIQEHSKLTEQMKDTFIKNVFDFKEKLKASL
jgi:hypothetical protein